MKNDIRSLRMNYYNCRDGLSMIRRKKFNQNIKYCTARIVLNVLEYFQAVLIANDRIVEIPHLKSLAILRYT